MYSSVLFLVIIYMPIFTNQKKKKTSYGVTIAKNHVMQERQVGGSMANHKAWGKGNNGRSNNNEGSNQGSQAVVE